ncbi:LysM domain-containing protein [Curtobacterium sp. VKM Ac-2922]|uniref:LysM domain-containing protein n=1 Tax=Curtobacterium sp. VKM Ac-2922 TaxID=2929475 RepID=UPI001FB253AF|nr:LysM domain-containing protein [Curtobacterium sp. VKM Ac-2922]MCJ1714335.1 LysM domain-containing protein [Curtobacterium sp. VKM Ac-2922]
MTVHRGLAIGLVVVAAVGLSGCSLLRGDSGGLPAPSRSASATPTASPSAPATSDADSEAERLRESASPRPPTAAPSQASMPAPTISTIPDGTVLAEADVTSPKGSVHFHYRVVAAGDSYAIEYSGFTSTLPVPVGVMLIDKAPAVGDGITAHGVGDHQLGGPTTTPAPTASTPLTGSSYDPSWLGTIVTYSDASSDPSIPVEIGPGKVLSVNSVRWSVPARTTNVHPVDGGARSGANGTVSATTASGAPASYVIAPDDLIANVADRFGISVEALIWLDPDLRVYGDQQWLYEGTTINLDPVRR